MGEKIVLGQAEAFGDAGKLCHSFRVVGKVKGALPGKVVSCRRVNHAGRLGGLDPPDRRLADPDRIGPWIGGLRPAPHRRIARENEWLGRNRGKDGHASVLSSSERFSASR